MQGNKCLVDIAIKDEKKATSLLENNGYQVLQSDVLVVKIKDEPNQMAPFTARLAKEKIHIISMGLLTKEGGYDTFSLQVDHPAKAKRVLSAYMRQDTQD